MPIFATPAKNTVLSALAIDSLSLHSAYSASGGNELVGGTPAYARLPATFAAPALGIRLLTGVPYIFDVPPASTVAWIGMWSGGTFQGMTPNAGGPVKPFVVDDLTSIKSAAHGFLTGDTLIVWAGSSGPLPVGLSEGTIYYVVAAATVDSLQVSASLAGPPVGLGFNGNGYIQRIAAAIYVGQDHFVLNGFSLDATVAA